MSIRTKISLVFAPLAAVLLFGMFTLINGQSIAGYTYLGDSAGDSAPRMEGTAPYTNRTSLFATRREFAMLFLGTGGALLVALALVLEFLVVKRLRELGRRVQKIRKQGDWSARIKASGGDEVSRLANDINTLIAALAESVRKEDEKDRRYRMLATNAPVGIYECTADAKCVFVNNRWREISGMSSEEAMGDGWRNALHPDDREWVRSMGKERFAKGEPFNFECRFQRPSGEIRQTVVSVVPLRDKVGAIYSCIGSVMDISEIRQVEAELRENEQRCRGIIELQAELVCRYRPDTILTYVNDAYCAYFGYTREELLGKSFLDVQPGDGPLDTVVLELRNISGPEMTHKKTLSGSGEERWQEWVNTPVRDHEGRITEFQAVGRDITERKMAEDALRESEAKLRSITASVADAIIMMDDDGLVTFWNEAAERTFGYARMEVLGRPVHEVIVPERYRASFQSGHARFLETDGGVTVGRTQEFQGVRKDGTEFPIELTIAGVHFSGAWHAIGTVRDITERKNSEEQIERNARTLRAANAQLEEAIASANQLALEAQVASVAKSDFVANMSHEIRTPLNGVIGMTMLLLDTGLDAEQREFAETIRTSGEALLGVVNDILDFSKIEAGKMELEFIEFDLRAAIEQIGDMLAPRAQEKGLEFAILIHHDVPEYVEGDPGRLRQVLINLAGNALKFTERGEIVVSARLNSRSDGNANLVFEVTDSGIGIPDDRIKQLFQPFTQADTSTTRKYGGTGLGLTISKRLTEAMGGTIGVRSAVGQGSTFFFTATFKVAQAPERATGDTLDSLAGLRVLAVDTSETGRRVYRELLREWGISFSEASNTEQAYDILRAAASNATPYAIALVDQFQPKLDVVSFARRVKADPVLTRTHLLLVTSWPKRGDAATMAQHGYEAYLTKPVKRGHLVEAIAAIANRQSGTGGPMRPVTQHSLNESARNRIRILLVEDNITNQKIATRVLEKLGYRCDIANNGQEALDAVRKTQYNLVLMDCQMPEMDGYDATRAIRQHDGDARYTPVVALTASAMRSDHDRCFEAGMDDVLTKPIQTDALKKLLDAFLSDHPPIRRRKPAAQDETSSKASQNPVDLDRLSEITMGDPELETELIITFLADTAQRIAELADVIESGDATSVRATAHALKGSAGNMGATSLHRIALDLEQMGKSGNIEGAQPAYESLRAEANRVKEYLSSYMQA